MQIQVFWIKILVCFFLMCLFDFPCLWIYQKFTFCLDDPPKKKKKKSLGNGHSSKQPFVSFSSCAYIFAHVEMFPYVSAMCSIYFH